MYSRILDAAATGFITQRRSYLTPSIISDPLEKDGVVAGGGSGRGINRGKDRFRVHEAKAQRLVFINHLLCGRVAKLVKAPV